MDNDAVAHQRRVERHCRVFGLKDPADMFRHQRIALGKRIGHRGDRDPIFDREIALFRHEDAIGEYQPAAIEARQQCAGIWQPSLSRQRQARRPAAWRRASARAGRYISIPRRGGAARPCASNRLKASSRNVATSPLPGSFAFGRGERRGQRLFGRRLHGANIRSHHAASSVNCA